MSTDKRDKVIQGLSVHGHDAGIPNQCEVCGCPYSDSTAWCSHELAKDALELLQSQQREIDSLRADLEAETRENLRLAEMVKPMEARVMTLEEVKANRLEPLWLDTQDGSYFEWALWRAYDDEDRLRFYWGDDGESWRVQVPPDDYGKTWRCWTSRPTEAERKAVPWEK